MTETARNNRLFGFKAEAELLQYFRNDGYTAERLHLTGKEDEGDLIIGAEEIDDYGYWKWYIVQLKTYAQRTAKGVERPLSHAKVRQWWKDLEAQREHYRAHRGLAVAPEGILVVKPRGAHWEDAMVIQRLGDWVG